jgi:uncharacterized surface protein with fasciclin (FAS1) repeats
MHHLVRGVALASLLTATSALAQTATPAAPAAPAPAAPAGTPATGTATTPATPAAGTPAAPAAGTPATAAPATAQAPNPSVGGAQMDAAKPIAANLAAAPTLSTLTGALKAAGLDAQLTGPGPFTVFAPTNDAFGRLAPGTVEKLMEPANKAALTKLLSYHVVQGTLTLEDLKKQMAAGGGTATLSTLAGDTLKITTEGAAIALSDAAGNKSYLQVPDVRESNGIVHVVNGVVVPKLS